jgi:hypothetical protein
MCPQVRVRLLLDARAHLTRRFKACEQRLVNLLFRDTCKSARLHRQSVSPLFRAEDTEAALRKAERRTDGCTEAPKLRQLDEKGHSLLNQERRSRASHYRALRNL